MLGLERVLSEKPPHLKSGTELRRHQVDALAGMLTELIAAAQHQPEPVADEPDEDYEEEEYEENGDNGDNGDDDNGNGHDDNGDNGNGHDDNGDNGNGHDDNGDNGHDDNDGDFRQDVSNLVCFTVAPPPAPEVTPIREVKEETPPPTVLPAVEVRPETLPRSGMEGNALLGLAAACLGLAYAGRRLRGSAQ
jgi:hypothetical protein